jgi:hypothetical protein
MFGGGRIDPAKVPIGRARTLERPQPFVAIAVVFGACFVLLAKNFLAAQHAFQEVQPAWLRALLNYSFLGNDGIATILAAVIGAVFLIRQITYSLSPELGYASYGEDRTVGGRARRFYCVRLTNTGTGTAEIVDVRYIVGLTGQAPATTGALDYASANRLIASSGLIEGLDYHLWAYSPGGSVIAGAAAPVFDCREDQYRAKLVTLDVVIWYRGRTGGLYAKRVACIPA